MKSHTTTFHVRDSVVVNKDQPGLQQRRMQVRSFWATAIFAETPRADVIASFIHRKCIFGNSLNRDLDVLMKKQLRGQKSRDWMEGRWQQWSTFNWKFCLWLKKMDIISLAFEITFEPDFVASKRFFLWPEVSFCWHRWIQFPTDILSFN